MVHAVSWSSRTGAPPPSSLRSLNSKVREGLLKNSSQAGLRPRYGSLPYATFGRMLKPPVGGTRRFLVDDYSLAVFTSSSYLYGVSLSVKTHPSLVRCLRQGQSEYLAFEICFLGVSMLRPSYDGCLRGLACLRLAMLLAVMLPDGCYNLAIFPIYAIIGNNLTGIITSSSTRYPCLYNQYNIKLIPSINSS